MLKKSLVLGIAALLLAVSLVFTGCENPDAPVVEGDNITFPPQGPTEVNINNPTTIPELPQGFTYPDAAQVVTGDATAIALAFNGGILVADTSDATGGSVVDPSAPGTGYAYAQDGVDEVLWAGPGTFDVSGTNLGSIVVPPGKTLFIGASLVIDGSTGTSTFTEISVSDMGSAGGGTPAQSIQASGAGGAHVTGTKALNPGRLVILAGAEIGAASAGSITVGGELEIHQGAGIVISGSTPLTFTQGSKAAVYGKITTGSANTFNGTLDIKAGAEVNAYADTGDLTFGDNVTLAGSLTLPNSGDVDFNGDLTVAQGVTLTLESGEATAFNKKATFNGTLVATGATVTIGSGGELAITSTGSITGDWNDFSTGGVDGTPSSLRAAIGAQEAGPANTRVTIAEPASGATYLGITLAIDPGTGYSRAAAYSDLQFFAKHDKIHLTLITSGIGANGLDTVFDGDDSVTTDDLVIAAENNVTLSAAAIGDVTVNQGGFLTLGAVTDASDITVLGTLTGGSATFSGSLKSLTIGSDAVTVNQTSTGTGALAAAVFTAASPVITVNRNSSLTVGNTAVDVDPAGTIDLKEGASFYLDSTGTTSDGTLNRLENLYIAAGAEFATNSSNNEVTFNALKELTVNGTLTVPSTGIAFAEIQGEVGGKGDVKGTGKAILAGWDVTFAGFAHAYDQLRAIRYLAVNSVTGIARISGTGTTVDQGEVPADAVLEIGDDTDGIVIPDRNLIVDRDLYLASGALISGPAGIANNKITIVKNKGIYAVGSGAGAAYLPVLGGVDQIEDVVFTLPTTAVKLTNPAAPSSGTIVLTVSTLTLGPGYTLQVPGVLVASAAGTGISAGAGSGLVSLGIGTELDNAAITVATATADPVDEPAGRKASLLVRGKLTVGGTSTIGATVAIPSAGTNLQKAFLELALGGEISATGAGNTLALGTGVIIGGNASESTLKGDAASSTITAADDDNTEFKGLFIGKGPKVLTGVATKNLKILENSWIRQGVNGYDYAELRGTATLTGANTFADGDITIVTAGKLLAGGILKTGGGGGGLVIINATVKATGENGQNLSGFTFDGSGNGAFYASGTAAATLTLSAGTEIALGSGTNPFGIGQNTASFGATTLAIGEGKISFIANVNPKITVSSDGASTPTVINHFTFGNYDLKSVAGTATLASEYVSVGVEGTAGPNDIFVTGTGSTKTSTNDGGTTLTLASGAPLITGSASGITTIDKDTRIVNSN